MEKLVKVGEIHDGYMLCQVAPARGMWIAVPSGNRKVDDVFDLNWSYDHGMYTVVRLEEEFAEKVSEKSDQVYITRYVRPKTAFGDIDNLRGVTLIIELDYVAKTIRFQYSICDGDNFCKDIGVQLAIRRLDRRGSYEIDMKDGKVSKSGAVFDIMTSIYETTKAGVCNMPARDAIKILGMYRESVAD